MRATRFAVLCSLIVFAALVASARSSAAAGARFRFGAQGSAAHLAPFARNAVAPGDTAWTGCGEKLTPDGTQQFTSLPVVFSAGSGGSLVAWSDQRSGRSACRASRLDFLGKYPAGWIAGGNLVSLSDSSQGLVSSGTDDAAGGFFVYTDVVTQFADIPVNVYLQHLTSSGGVAAGYPPGGKLMAAGYVGVAGMLPDGSGGLFLGWAAGPDLYEKIRVTRLDASGTATAGWPAGGVDTGLRDTVPGEPASDGAGGIYLVWSQGTEVKIQRYTSTGVVSGWPVGGLTVATSYAGADHTFVRLSNNDALVCWVDPNYVIRAMRVNAAGSLDVGWPAGGKEISPAIGQEHPVLLEDAAGGALILCEQHTGGPPLFLPQLYVQHLTSAGAVATGWPAEGVPLSSSATVRGYIQSLVSDGAGGAIAAWTDLRGSDEDVYAQRVLATGVVDPAWTADGVAICTAAGNQEVDAITTDGSGGAILTLRDYADSNNPQIRAARLLVNGIVSTLASLVDAAVEPGRVRLHWYTADGSVTMATVERADAGGAFVPVGEITADGVGHLRFEDRNVKAGATYLYRLAVRDGATTSYLGQVTIHVPAAVSFGIDGFRPNPAQGQVSVVFALESASPARLELRDVAGRRVMTREVGMLGAGQHVLPLGQAAALPAGIYVLRLTQSGHEAVARAALVR